MDIVTYAAATKKINSAGGAGGAGGSNVFYVPFGHNSYGFYLLPSGGVTFADIISHYNAGDVIIGKATVPESAGYGVTGELQIPLQSVSEDRKNISFSFTTHLMEVVINLNDAGNKFTFCRKIQSAEQKTDTISAESTNEQYPSALAVYTAIQDSIANDGAGNDDAAAASGIRYGFDVNTGTLYLYGDGEYNTDSSTNHDDIKEQVKHIVFFENISSIGDEVCAGHFPLLETVTMCNSITETGFGVFTFSSKLRKVHLSKNLTALHARTFRDTALEEIKIPASLTVIYSEDFANCENLKKVEFEKASELSEIKIKAFAGCASLSSIELPDQLTTLGSRVFKDNTALRLVTLPATLTSLGTDVFENCTALEFAIYEGTREQWEALEGSTSNATALTDEILYCLSEKGATDNMATQLMPAMGVTGQGASYDIYKTASGNAVLSYYVEKASSGVDYGISMEAVEMKIDNRAAVKEIRIANGVTAIVSMDSSTSAFGSTDIREIYIPDTVTSIGAYAFAGCSKLERVYIPAGATLGTYAFACQNLTDIYFGGTQEEWQEYDTSAEYFGILDSQYTVHYNATGLPD